MYIAILLLLFVVEDAEVLLTVVESDGLHGLIVLGLELEH